MHYHFNGMHHWHICNNNIVLTINIQTIYVATIIAWHVESPYC